MPQYQVILRGTYQQAVTVTAASPGEAKRLAARAEWDDESVVDQTSWHVAKDAAVLLEPADD